MKSKRRMRFVTILAVSNVDGMELISPRSLGASRVDRKAQALQPFFGSH